MTVIDAGRPTAHLYTSANIALDHPVTGDQLTIFWASAIWRLEPDGTWALESLTLAGKYPDGDTPAGRSYSNRTTDDLRDELPDDIRPIAEALRPSTIGISEPDLARCPTCSSPEPRLHPAVQAEGEVTHICPDPFHRTPSPEGATT